MSLMNDAGLWGNKQSIFRSVIKDIATKYENINKKLLISFKNDFVHTSSTNEVIGTINHEKFKQQLKYKENRNTGHFFDSREYRRSEVNNSVNKRYSSINLSPKIEYGQNRNLNTAYTSNSRKRKSNYPKHTELVQGESHSMIDRAKNISIGERKSVTIEEVNST